MTASDPIASAASQRQNAISPFHPVLPEPASRVAHWGRLSETAASLAVVETARQHAGPVLAVAGGELQAQRLEQTLNFFADGTLPVVHFPDAETLPYDQFSPHQEILSDRLSALYDLPQFKRGIVLITAEALMLRLPPQRYLDGRVFMLQSGQTLNLTDFRNRLSAAGYASVSEVQTQGEFAVRGALIDVFPMGCEAAFRVDLFDQEVESIRMFDPETQRSTEKVSDIRLLPAREFPTDPEGIETFRRRYREYFPGDPARSRIYSEVSKGFMPGGVEAWLPLFFDQTARLVDYLPPQTLMVPLADLSAVMDEDWRQIQDRYERYGGNLERPLMQPADLYVEPQQALMNCAPLASVDLRVDTPEESTGALSNVRETLESAEERVLLIAESAGRQDALINWLKPLGIKPRTHESWTAFLSAKNRYSICIGPLQDSLRMADDGIWLLSEAQIFGARAPASSRKRNRTRDPDTILRDLSALEIGSPVVHVQHGVGRYQGLVRMDAGGIETEFLVLEYAKRKKRGVQQKSFSDDTPERDKLYVPVASLSLIHRYTGAEDEGAPLHQLGSERWNKARAKAREKANDVAAELLQIQARRAAKPGNEIEVAEQDYQTFCEGFPFDTTPDQQNAIDAVLSDLGQSQPMDRVVCGDVGFGKTEVALRASFAVARAGRQVCLLAPTTLLAQQHEKNFQDRFAGTALRVAALSRMRSAKEQKELLTQLESGAVDIVIGTHRLLQEDVRFKDLGLVVIDEEHRFGVRHKERMKNLRAEVDLLTLTATPIPRTLNMSLAGLRDLSIIATPPASRLAIRTFVAEWEQGLVYEACQRELRRGGQVYFLHNDVASIEKFSADIQALVPEAKVRFAHGQMRERELEQVMLDFYHQRFNILVCTTIIESGIDVPSANTILMDRADRLGLAQLHQLRGRVGRSHHRAYAYLLVPSRRALSTDAQKRLEAIEALGDLGSGFALATHDLEIRGAGELLGEGQSGQIEEIGFTMYSDMLARAVKAIQSGKLDDAPLGASACEIDLGVSALIPDDYVPDVQTRLVFYKRLAEATDEETIDELRVEMVDRFGLLPVQAERLVELSRLRMSAEAMGIRKIRASDQSASLEFGDAPKINPAALIKLIQSQPKVYKLEGQKRLHIAAGNLDQADQRAPRLKALLVKLAA